MDSMHDRVIIGVSGESMTTRSVRSILQRLRDHGITAVFLSSFDKDPQTDAARDIAWVDALIIMGNNRDIDPRKYIDRYPEGDKRRCVHPCTNNEMACSKGIVRANYEEKLLQSALKARIPLLAVCGGMHRLNVQCGGTLHQHIPELVGSDKHMQHKQGIDPVVPVLPIIIKQKTMLWDIAGELPMPFVREGEVCDKVIMENSMHHQALDIVGEQLQVCAVTDTIQFSKWRQWFHGHGGGIRPGGYIRQSVCAGGAVASGIRRQLPGRPHD